MDEEGFIFIVDRIKDLINCSGFKVYPRRIEEAIYEHPAVEEVTVIGIQDAYRGEAPKAFVKLKEGVQATEAELIEYPARRSSPRSSCRPRSSSATAAEDHDRQALQEGAARRAGGEKPIGLERVAKTWMAGPSPAEAIEEIMLRPA